MRKINEQQKMPLSRKIIFEEAWVTEVSYCNTRLQNNKNCENQSKLSFIKEL